MNIKTLIFPLIALLAFGCARPLNLSFSVPEQMNYQYKSSTISHTVSKVMGMDVQANSSQEFTYTMKDLGKTSDGNFRVGLNYDRIIVTQSAMGNETSYDSSVSDENNDPTTSKVYGAMLENPFELIYTPKGRITEAPGMDKMMDAVFSTLPTEAKEAMKTQLNEDVFIQMFQASSNFYPSTPIKKGSQWEQSQQLNILGMNMDINMTYTLDSRKDGQAFISLNGTVSTDPEGSGMEMAGMTMNYELDGTQNGSLIIDEQTGMATHVEIEQDLDGTMSMDNPATGPMEIDMEINTNIFTDLVNKH